MDLLAIIISLLMITVLIVVHEFGHFLAAKYYGFQTPVFGIGLPVGPGIDLFKKWGTQFKFYFALIGGFVAIPELGDETDEDLVKEYKLEKPLREFPVGERAVVASAGIVFNILFAFLLAVVMAASIGLPSVVANNKIAAFVGEDSVAKQAGLLVGDKIIQINDTVIQSATELQDMVKSTANQKIKLVIDRENESKLSIELDSPGSLGIVLGHEKTYKKIPDNPLLWIWEAFSFTMTTLLAMIVSIFGILAALLAKLLSVFNPSQIQTGVNLGDIKGIVGIVQLISQDIKGNAVLLFDFAILLSLNLAVINLLPIPALDGGHLLFMAYEAIFKKKADEKIQNRAVQMGFLFLISIILITTFNDLKNWIWG
jgi:membrane-associated protease RseP (regulator of RpoE activity)